MIDEKTSDISVQDGQNEERVSLTKERDDALKEAKKWETSHSELERKLGTQGTELGRLRELERKLEETPPVDFNLPDDEYVQAKDVKAAIASAIASVKKELQPTLQSINSSVIESQVAQIRAKRPDMTNEEIQKVVAIQQTFKPELMKSMLIQMGYSNLQSTSSEDIALFLSDGIQKGLISGDGGITGIHKQGIRGSGLPKKDSDDDKLTALGKTDKEIAEIKQLCSDTNITVKDWLEHYHPPMEAHTAK